MPAPPPDNVVLNKAAAEALRREFVGWQCRVRQLAAREDGGRPSSGMRPRVMSLDGTELSAAVTTLIIETAPRESTELFRYQYLRTNDPNERYEKMLEILQASYFQDPARFSDLMTALFSSGSGLAATLVAEGRCVLEFEQYTQGYRVPCAVSRLAASTAFYEATVWHNRMFNPRLPPDPEILAFRPDWPHARDFRVAP
jgi:hypothetical protein